MVVVFKTHNSDSDSIGPATPPTRQAQFLSILKPKKHSRYSLPINVWKPLPGKADIKSGKLQSRLKRLEKQALHRKLQKMAREQDVGDPRPNDARQVNDAGAAT